MHALRQTGFHHRRIIDRHRFSLTIGCSFNRLPPSSCAAPEMPRISQRVNSTGEVRLNQRVPFRFNGMMLGFFQLGPEKCAGRKGYVV